jgi:hypothetical protein
MTNDARRYLFFGAIIILAVVIGISLIPTPKHKRTSTAKESAQNECGVRAYTKYLQNKLALLQVDNSNPLSVLSVERTIAKRRLEEQFCLEFVRCVLGLTVSESVICIDIRLMPS